VGMTVIVDVPKWLIARVEAALQQLQEVIHG
jgi:hypothetical protein